MERAGCIFIELEAEPGTTLSHLVLWPHRWSIDVSESGTIQILDHARRPVAEVGNEVVMGGGMTGGGAADMERATELAEEAIGEPIPERCVPQDGYWGANPDVHVRG